MRGDHEQRRPALLYAYGHGLMTRDLNERKTLLLSSDQPEALRQAADSLRAGELVAFPTDTVYGLGALIWNEAGIARMYAAKERPPEKAIPILLSDLSEAQRLVGALPAAMEILTRRFWPGPLTLVVPCGDRVPDFITSGSGTVALRIPSHPVALLLLSLLGQPLAVTSANRSGSSSPLTAQNVLDQLAGRIDVVVDGGPCPGGVPSTVISLATDPPTLLRAGPIGVSELSQTLEKDGFKVRVVT